jgi:hypothetical protein
MANTYSLINSITVGSGGASTIDFTSISSGFTDLCLKLSLRTANAAAYNSASVTFNGSSSGYSEINLYGNSTGTVSLSNSGAQIDYLWADAASATSSTFGNAEIYIPNYAGSTNKSVSFDISTENNATTTNASFVGFMTALWSNTAAINRVTITAGSSSTFAQYSTAYLYGIKNS